MAMRVSRIVSGKSKAIKFAGHFHGWHDGLIPGADAPHNVPSYNMPGVTDGVMGDLVIVPPNDLAAVERAIDEHDPACVFVEATGGHFGTVPVRGEFLRGLRELTQRKGVILVCDEVITGFRVHPGGAQTLYDIRPDLTALGKVIGGGLPVGAYGGRRDIMEMVAPVGPMYQAGTLSGNPLAMTAGIATLRGLSQPGVWDQLETTGAQLMEGLAAVAREAGVTISTNRVGTMFGLFFSEGPVTDWSSASQADTQAFARYFQAMLDHGVYIAPSQFEAGFLSTAHGPTEIEATVWAAAQAFQRIVER